MCAFYCGIVAVESETFLVGANNQNETKKKENNILNLSTRI